MATLTVEQVEQISARLKELPAVENKKRPISKQEAIKLLARDIKSLQARGYSLEQVSEQLKQLGVSLATPTLRSYLKRAGSGTATRKKGSGAGIAATATEDQQQPAQPTA
ncbi:hypothetical protein ABVY06_004626 [Escherichia coli]